MLELSIGIFFAVFFRGKWSFNLRLEMFSVIILYFCSKLLVKQNIFPEKIDGFPVTNYKWVANTANLHLLVEFTRV